jgi:hypothetical protein
MLTRRNLFQRIVGAFVGSLLSKTALIAPAVEIGDIEIVWRHWTWTYERPTIIVPHETAHI